MSLRLERIRGATLIRAALTVALTVALVAAMLAVSPEAAEAQTSAQTEDRSAPSVVVRPGDSLWSISEGLLGPDASPRRVMKGAERIHVLNRSRIGADPNLVLAGQVLSVPWAMSGQPTGAATPAREAAEASGSNPKDGAAASEGRETPERRGPGQGDIPRSEISLEEAARMLGADTNAKEKLPDPRAAAPVHDVRTVVSNGAQFGALFGILPETSAGDRRRLLGLGIWILTLVAASLIAAHGLGYLRAGARKQDLGFREAYGSSYGSSYAAFEPLAGPEDAPRRVPEAHDRTAYPDGPTNEGTVSEDRFDLTDPLVLARVKRARVRRQPPRPRPHGLRRPVRTRAQRRPSSGRRRATVRAVRKEWEPGAALADALGEMPLRSRTSPGADLAWLKPHLEEALGELGRLERLRGLSRREKTRREALMALKAAVERDE